jgi:hypothetical protein
VKKALSVFLMGLLGSAFAAPPAGAGSNVLENPTLLEGHNTSIGAEPVAWTRRGLMEFSNARMAHKDNAYQFSLTADESADFPAKCSSNAALHYDGSEAGYFQISEGVEEGQTWRTKIGSKLLSGGRARLFLYARDASAKNLKWKADLSRGNLNKWQRLRVTMKLPTGTASVMVGFRGRVCKPGTEKFRFRNAVLRRLSD